MSTWTTFGSIIHHKKPLREGLTTGHNNREGVSYRWAFEAETGRFGMVIEVEQACIFHSGGDKAFLRVR